MEIEISLFMFGSQNGSKEANTAVNPAKKKFRRVCVCG